jgi:glutaredoxin
VKLVIRYFFKLVHAIVGPILLAVDRLTSPGGIERSPQAQQQVDERTRKLSLYQFRTCPFCIRTRRAIKRLSLNIETRDALRDAENRARLLEGGGKVKVPCLRICDDGGNVQWLYESGDIIRYLKENFA